MTLSPKVLPCYTALQFLEISALGAQRGDVIQHGFSQTTNLIPSLDNGLTFDATLSNPFPSGILEPRGSEDGLLTFVGRGLSFFNENPKAAYQRRPLSLQYLSRSPVRDQATIDYLTQQVPTPSFLCCRAPACHAKPCLGPTFSLGSQPPLHWTHQHHV